MNILTFDVEEWFHLLAFDNTRTEAQWGKYEVRIYENVDRILDILERTNTKATFFIIGWVAKTYPDVVKKIAAKYQIGSHTMNHQLVWQQTPEEFRKDVESSIKLLQDITGQPIECFRAPGFSIRESESWAYDILADLGIKYDCSVFPAHHAHGGMARFGAPVPSLIKHGDVEMKEFPVTTKTILGKKIVFSGGGYFRLVPYRLLKSWSAECANGYANHMVPRVWHDKDGNVVMGDDGFPVTRNVGYLLSYIHPRDLDGGQPMLEGLPLKRKFKSYVGVKGAAEKLRYYLEDFKFVDVKTAADNICWEKVPVVAI
jgi:polysaccharide deacetylase family protein (PEP-CTERM system associated)